MRMNKRWAITVALLAAMLAGCGRKSAPPLDPGRLPGWTETGVASWYGPGFHGKRTANGEVYNMNAQTAAHKTLPFGTWVRVHNLDNDRSTRVRINDRGPFVRGRIIDLSRKAARDIGMERAGVARVRLSVAQPPAASSDSKQTASGIYSVQAGSFRNRNRAEKLRNQLGSTYGPADIESASVKGQLFHRVLVGRLDSLPQARLLADRIYREQHLPSRPFVLRREQGPDS